MAGRVVLEVREMIDLMSSVRVLAEIAAEIGDRAQAGGPVPSILAFSAKGQALAVLAGCGRWTCRSGWTGRGRQCRYGAALN